MNTTECFPDGTPLDAWFYETTPPALETLGPAHTLTEYGIAPDGRLHTRQIQAAIDSIAAAGGGVLVVPAGVYQTGALYFRQGVHLHLAAGAVLQGSDDIADYDLLDTRIEGENCRYFGALLNADGLDGFTITGPGVIDGNGLRSWRAFWLRRKWNPACTNKDEQRPRLLYLSNCQNVWLAGVTLQNAHFWTTHLYRCRRVKYIGCRILSPAAPVPAPSTDGIDIDVCTDVLVKDCELAVNDDAIALKGGRGPWADTRPENGANARILIEDCRFGFCHSCLTCGSESIDDRNLLARRLQVAGAGNLLRLKMRPDTPQRYADLRVEQVTGRVGSFLNVKPWTQFYDCQGRTDVPLSLAERITMADCRLRCHTAFDIDPRPDQYRLSHLTFERLDLQAQARCELPAWLTDASWTDCTVTPAPAETPAFTDPL